MKLPMPKFPKAKLEKPPETLAGKAFLAAKPYLEKGKDNPALLALHSNLEMFVGVIELSPGFQKEFYNWFQEVKVIETEFSMPEPEPPPELLESPPEPPTEINNLIHQAEEEKDKVLEDKRDRREKEESDASNRGS